MKNIYNHTGQCHCGNIHFTFETATALPDIATRCCSCSFCQKHASRYTSDPKGALKVKISHPENVKRYRFGHQTADFFICSVCGAFPFVTSEIDGNIYAVLNVNCLDSLDQISLKSGAVSHGSEPKEDRLSRRKKNWIGTVSIQE